MLNEGLIFDNSSIPNPMHCSKSKMPNLFKDFAAKFRPGSLDSSYSFTKTISFHISFQIHDSQTYLVVNMFGTVLLVRLLFQTRRKGTIK